MHLAVRLAEAAYVALFAAILPLLAFASRGRFDDGRIPAGRRLFVQVLAQLVVLGLIATVAAAVTGLPILAAPRLSAPVLASCAAFLAIAAGTIPLRWRRASPKDRERLGRLLPRGREDAATWTLVCLAAGYSEELAYRGVLTGILAGWTGSLLAASIFSAIAFGLAHAVQGMRSVAVVVVFGLAFQALCVLSGSLLPAMIVHALYDLVAGAAYARLAARERDERAAEASTD